MEIYDKLTQVLSKDWFDIRHTGSCYGIVEEEKGAAVKNAEIVYHGKLMSINKDIFKKLEDTEIWEFRTLFNGTCYRFFAFWDTELEALVVATHGIVKKTQKTPKKEIKKAEAIRKEYFDDKNKQ